MPTHEIEYYHIHSDSSNPTIIDSVTTLPEYAEKFKELGCHCLSSCAHGTQGNVYLANDIAQSYCNQGYDMKALCVAEAYFVPDGTLPDRTNAHLILAAKTDEGRKQINYALSRANIERFYFRPRVDFDVLSEMDPKHVLCTTACVGGIWKYENYEEILLRLRDIFTNSLFLEVQFHDADNQREINEHIMRLYRKYNIPLIYGSDSHYVREADRALRQYRLEANKLFYADEGEFLLHVPSVDEIFARFKQQGVLPTNYVMEAVNNTLIFRDCEKLCITNERKLPTVYPQLTHQEKSDMYRGLVLSGYKEKCAHLPPDVLKQDEIELEKEIDAICSTETEDYFLVLKEIVERGLKKGGILTKSGRGSAVSFASNFALGLTSINRLHTPVKFYPERFISKERLAAGSNPDLDANLSNAECFVEAGKEVLGEWGCVPMVAFGKLAALSAWKMYARAKDLDFDVANEVSEQIKRYEAAIKYAEDDEDKDEILLEDYVSAEYYPLVEESKQYTGIINSISPHPCAHLLLDKDIRREIGVIRLKPKAGSKEDLYAAYIDGAQADALGYIKMDFLRVDTVGITADAFHAANVPIPSIDELLTLTKDDQAVWSMYSKGLTMGLNQVEKEKTTEKIMRYKPKNISELSAFVAAVRPGFKSMVETFISRRRFSYGIDSLDALLQTKEIPDSFLMFDEQILTVLQQGGIPASEAYVCIKAIKKKKHDKVMKYKEAFASGFSQFLIEKEKLSEAEALRVVDQIWTIINDAASYMFCAAHAYSVACDSQYGAYLKTHYPYEFYFTMLKLYTAKGDKNRIAKIKEEMLKGFGIRVTPCRFRQDNRTWYIDKENHTISNELSSVKFMSKKAALDLYRMSNNQYQTFTDLLCDLFFNTCLDSRQTSILIRMGYFQEFGSSGKLMKVFDAFLNGKNKITKTLKQTTVDARLDALRIFERTCEESELPIKDQIKFEIEHFGLPVTIDPAAKKHCAVVELNTKFSPRAKLYNIHTGRTGVMKVLKKDYNLQPFNEGDVIIVHDWMPKPAYAYKDGQRVIVPGVKENWITDYEIL